jgi:cellobiose phosphorylase
MAAMSRAVGATLLRWLTRLRGSSLADSTVADDPPLRSELLSADQMKQHGRSLAGAHELARRWAPDRLLARLADNERILIEACKLLTEALAADRRIVPAGEWLLDNFYLIEEQIRTARRHLPEGYSRQLPRLRSGPSAGLPRVYDIALEAISHGDGRVDPEGLAGFVAAYQEVTALKLGELWAIPIMLRLALIENLRRVGARVAAARIERDRAAAWAEQMAAVAKKDPKSLILVTADMARANPPMASPFVAELALRLQGLSLTLPLTWIEQRLSESGLTIEQVVHAENQQQAADQVSISNSIGSLRILGATDWRKFVESTSTVEQALREDPAGVYRGMDFATRDQYRRTVEAIARRSPLAESEVARQAIELARAGSGTGDERTQHVGFYLIDQGLPQLERAAQVKGSIVGALRGPNGRFSLLVYLGGIGLLTAIGTAGLVARVKADGGPDWILAAVGILAALCASQLAVALVNWLATVLATPHLLPRMDYSAGIPSQSRTLVAVPTMLASAADIADLVEALEVRFLANRDENLRFGLLTDLPDASEETLPKDEALVSLAKTKIEELNAKYRSPNHDPFLLFHRPRRFNSRDRIWMGYERKRGKLAALNALLRGRGPQADFSLVVGNTAGLQEVKYVITLDTDTQLPRDSARQLIGALAHPLNRARFDARTQRVCAGYGILQPRIAESLSSQNRSPYAQLWGSEPGLDPYTRAVSDVYQDLFQEGSFSGKGIYDVDAFERALAGRFPENRILSHDLVEGCYARSGLLTDVQLYEEYPPRYRADVSRRHRWIRGDWQIARWLLPWVPVSNPATHWQRNPLSLLARWKIFDNLRRSLVPVAATLWLLLGWTYLLRPWFWSLTLLGVILIPPAAASLLDLLRKPKDVLLVQHLTGSGRSAVRRFAQAGFAFACLPYEALFSLDAIVRTAFRVLVSHRRLLEWSLSGDAKSTDSSHVAWGARQLRRRRTVAGGHGEAERSERGGGGGGGPKGGANPSRVPISTGLARSFRNMGIAPVLSAAAALFLAHFRPSVLAIAAPILALWFASPALAWWSSQPLPRRAARLTAAEIRFLRALARKTWAFFATFVGPKDHWLPPDNVQEHPAAAIAHRTSPTNMGLSLLANLAAHDFGYLSTGRLVERTANAIHTMQSMERHRGHFYNWYDTQSLTPLRPHYVSSVDSGNLAGHLLTLRQGLLGLLDEKIVGPSLFAGIADSLQMVVDATEDAVSGELARVESAVISAADDPPRTLTTVRHRLESIAKAAELLVDRLAAGPEGQARVWARALAQQCQDALADLAFIAPWTSLPEAPSSPDGFPGLDGIPTLRELAQAASRLLPAIEARLWPGAADPDWWAELQRLVAECSQRAQKRIAVLQRLAFHAGELARMEYDFLFDETRHLLAVGYNVDDRRRDSSYYDLLASEARLCTFVAIAQGQLPQESWFALGRRLTSAGGRPILLSWSGSMFEYLMPLLVMPTYDGTLLDQTCRTAVERQIEYGDQRGVPWGMSECGYNTVDAHLNYQYRAFGVPGLGLKRGLAEDLVVAPYASALALMVAPAQACKNLQRLAAEEYEGNFGFYEAIDYTPSRLPRGQTRAVVRSFMAHHQGMSLLSLAHVLLDRPMQKRFESDPAFQATTLLLQERIPKAVAPYVHTAELAQSQTAASGPETPVRVFDTPHTIAPEVQLLSNGRYHVMITNAGGGYSRWNDIAVTRWREDSTRDHWGTFCYLRDVASGKFWSTAYQPALKRQDSYQAIFSESRAEFRCRKHDLDAYTEIAVSPEDDVELRRITITNRGRRRRTIDLTSYAEVVLTLPAADAEHPGFSNLFVQSEILRDRQAILATRRPRSVSEPAPWMFHLMAVHGAEAGTISYETDRGRFIGRGHTVADPQAMQSDARLSDSQGSVLDPIVAIRKRITLAADASATINIVSGVAQTRDGCLGLVDKYQDRRLADRVFDLAWTHSQVALRQINASDADAQLYGRLAGAILYANASLRADPNVVKKNRRGQSGLWGYSISGDLPIVLLKIGDPANIELVRQLVQAHAYWRRRGLKVDLVIWNEDHSGYRQVLHDQIMGLIAAGGETNVTDRPGGIFVRPADQIADEDRILVQTVARVVLTDARGDLASQIDQRGQAERAYPPPLAVRPLRIESPAPSAHTVGPRPDLIFFNGLGGFTPDGREYVITTAPGRATPAPWVNVLANSQFGTVLSESGAAYTWAENAHEFRLTPWENDPVGDTSGEALYLRDEESGQFWSPTPLPSPGSPEHPTVTRHGFGYSVFEHSEGGIHTELWIYVDVNAPVKFLVLKLRNDSGRPRRLSATAYVEWVLGDQRAKSAPHVVTNADPGTGALFARNPYSTEFADRVAFLDADDMSGTVTGDRSEFLGRNGTPRSPAALTRARLSGKLGATLDPCAAIQVPFELWQGQEREIIFRLGVGRSIEDAADLVHRHRGSAAARSALEAIWQYWNHTLGAVQVETPERALDVLANGWLLYQTLACRLWARSGSYQSGGAFGFRDQLQDTMALIHCEPRLLREQLLLCAAHQFREGDVQHWWHPPSGRGVRTHCSDDYLWLPLATCRYTLGTGDTGVLDEVVPFLDGRPVHAEEDSYYDLPRRSAEADTLYAHCTRAILHGLRCGSHGLPLIGSGDWNDGMNCVGAAGKGESVWLGFFLFEVLDRFTELARRRSDLVFAERCQSEAAELRRNIEASGWDGQWYRRAFFDDGSPLGSASSPECQIDSIAQSWSVLSRAGDPERSRLAMNAVDRRLVRREYSLIQLLDPPFDKSNLDPGYIKGYVPGVRENGGQYTHAAVWATMAFAALGDARRMWELLAMINPVNHAKSPEAMQIYKVEPYVVAADVYAVTPHIGRGGWTWYTGSAGWLYRLIVESLLGLRLDVDKLHLAPCLPADWQGFTVHYRHRETVYHIKAARAAAVSGGMTVTVDGVEQQDPVIPLADDRREHLVEVRMG